MRQGLFKRIAGPLLTALLLGNANFIALQAFAQVGDESSESQSPEYRSAAPGVELQLGSRPLRLVDDLRPGVLKNRLSACREMNFRPTDFSIGHRGAPLGFPEHTVESYVAAARQGAGIVECDVTFTRDRELVCRHSQCDLHKTTNILEIPHLAARCSQPFKSYDPVTGTPASAHCCTSDITLAEFRTLRGRRAVTDPRADTVEAYLTPGATNAGQGTLLTHAESIRLFEELGVKMTPELKAPSVAMPYEGDFTQHDYAQKMIDEYQQARVHPSKVWAQSFNLEDVKYWIDNEPRFGKQAVYLDNRVYANPPLEPTLADFESLKRRGVRIVAPPMFALLELDAEGRIVPSEYARLARLAGLDIITWTFERTDLRDGAQASEFFYSSIADAIDSDGDRYLALDVLAREVNSSLSYYQEKLGGEGIDTIFVRSVGKPMDEMTALLEPLSFRRVIPVDPASV